MEIYVYFIALIIVLISTFSFFSLAPWVPTKGKDLERINHLTKLKKDEKFLEIWCGTAKVSLYIAKQNPASQITGIELSLPLYLISRWKVFFSGLKNIDVIYGNALKADFSIYDMIYVFGLPDTMSSKVTPKLEREIKKTARFISYCFQMNSFAFSETKSKPNKDAYATYVYKKK